MANPNPKTDQIRPYQWRPGQSGGYRGGSQPKSLTALLRKAAEKRELFGQPMPEGQDVGETFADACFAWAIKGNPAFASQILDRLEGKVPAAKDGDDDARTIKVIIERVSRPVTATPPESGEDSDDGEAV